MLHLEKSLTKQKCSLVQSLYFSSFTGCDEITVAVVVEQQDFFKGGIK